MHEQQFLICIKLVKAILRLLTLYHPCVVSTFVPSYSSFPYIVVQGSYALPAIKYILLCTFLYIRTVLFVLYFFHFGIRTTGRVFHFFQTFTHSVIILDKGRTCLSLYSTKYATLRQLFFINNVSMFP
jgi:heme/copper-type cytochrome/quinol oxidase subunit 4